MATLDTIDTLKSRILSHFSLLFLDTWEEQRWERELHNLADQMDWTFVTWSVTVGSGREPAAENASRVFDPMDFLVEIESYGPKHLFLLKDFQPYLSEPHIVRKLRDLAARIPSEDKAILLMGPEPVVPTELRKDSLTVPMPLPNLEELRVELHSVLRDQRQSGSVVLDVSAEQEEKLLKAILGLTASEARKAFARALIGRKRIDDDVFALLVSEKKHMVQGSELLEFQALQEGIADVGGLEALKDWMARRADAFTERAREQGIPAPKGVLLLGVQGCGKSLTARAVARLLSFPLVRLDVATLLSADLGQSEKNMRDVLTLMEMIAPAVLWLDEIEKGFAGTDGASSTDATMVRIMGRFLTWMQENPAPVFVVATANSVEALPPEMLRRGRFDELFFVDLPNYHERIDIFKIHLEKRGWQPDQFEVKELAERTEGFSGAEIEQIVVSAMVDTFGRGESLNNEALDRARDETVPLSVTMEERIFALREWARPRCRAATPDSRVLQMLEAEQREQGRGEDTPFAAEPDLRLDDVEDAWVDLAEGGELTAAVVEYVRSQDSVTFARIKEVFSEYIETDGQQGLALRSDPNAVVALGLSRDLAGALAKAISAKTIYLLPVNDPNDAEVPDDNRLPILSSLPEGRVERPSFLTVRLTDIAPEGLSSRLIRVARMKLSR